MKLKEAIQSANLLSATTHARAKADAVEGKAEQPRPTLTFDGCGINGPDEYRSRLATFTNREEGKRWGPLLAAAPELLQSIKPELLSAWASHIERFAPGIAADMREMAEEQRAAVSKAKGSL